MRLAHPPFFFKNIFLLFFLPTEKVCQESPPFSAGFSLFFMVASAQEQKKKKI
jgi:hypothetical protein